MKTRTLCLLLSLVFVASCASIPKETITLSKSVGTDLQILHDSHKNAVQLYYKNIKSNIEEFITDVYTPFTIHHVLETELNKHKGGEPSLYGAIEAAGKSGGKEETTEALNVMAEFIEAANYQIELKKSELLTPIQEQERETINAIDRSYQNTIYANATLTAYLTSVHKVKEAQDEALSLVGIKDGTNAITNNLVELSGFVDTLTREAKRIDIQSDKAAEQINAIINKIKEQTNNTKNEK